jgi:hypothetical protein
VLRECNESIPKKRAAVEKSQHKRKKHKSLSSHLDVGKKSSLIPKEGATAPKRAWCHREVSTMRKVEKEILESRINSSQARSKRIDGDKLTRRLGHLGGI